MDCLVPGVAESWTRLSDFHVTSQACSGCLQSGHMRILEVSLAGGASRGLRLSQVETQRGFGWGRLLGPEGMEGEAVRTEETVGCYWVAR